ncbi:hypothetical protein LH464_17310 [Neorhizobium sp. T786]|uniref:hypothetical protein n=1 Tax=Pseudorhizobium xiangyangii TaxID=2883104 RepID=UPI001CFFBAD7|nr:hypothetical protein [Neorhizobium xiangyangii]MCB5204227.1 hypothetical protein [Neorhizobium xiangyangii]
MKTVTFDRILEALTEEYRKDGHEVVEQEGVHYARLSIEISNWVDELLSETNLTRLADQIVRRLA